MAVLYTQHYYQGFDDDGNPLSGGKLYTYAAGTDTPKATYTTAAGNIAQTNPIVLDAAGRAIFFLVGSYKFVLKDANDATISNGTTDNITAFSATPASSNAFFQTFSGNSSTTGFTLSENLGTDEKAIMVFIDDGMNEFSTNGTFATDTGWTKGSGWTIGSGVATASGAISTALTQNAGLTLIEGTSYTVKFDATRSAGSITVSIGGTAGTARSSSATFSETIIAGSSQEIAFTGSGFTGTIDNVTVHRTQTLGLQVINPSAYTLSGTTLTFNTAPKSGTNNIFVFAPSTLVGAASAAATAAANAQTGAELAEDGAEAAEDGAVAAANIAKAAAGFTYTYDTDTTASDPGSGFLRLNNATLASATALYISETTGASQAIAAEIATWDDSTSTIHGKLRMFKQADPSVFALFDVTGTITDGGSWDTLTVAYVSGSGSFSDNDPVTIQYIRNGDKGDTGATGSQGVPGAFLPIADAGGTADAITANYSPDVTLTDKVVVAVVAASANATTTPTFSPDGLTARTIVKEGGAALVAGDIAGAGHVLMLEYNSANTRWELLNPKQNSGTTANKLVRLDGSAKLPAVDGSQLTNISGGYKGSGFATNRYYFGLNGSASNTGTAMTANRLYFCPFQIGAADTFTRIGLHVTSGSGNCRMGIYRMANGVPSTLVLDAGTASVSGTGEVEITISQALTPDAYCLAAVFDGTPSIIQFTPNYDMNSFWGTVVGRFQAVQGDYQAAYTAHTYGALPTTPGALTYTSSGSGSNSTPSIWLRKV